MSAPTGATARFVYLLSLSIGFTRAVILAEVWIRFRDQPLTEPTMIPAM